MTTRDEVLAWQKRTAAFVATPLGAAFFKFKRKIERASRLDAEDNFSDNDRKATRQAIEEAASAEREFRALLEPLSDEQLKIETWYNAAKLCLLEGSTGELHRLVVEYQRSQGERDDVGI